MLCFVTQVSDVSFKNVYGNEILNLTFVIFIFLRLTFCYLSIPGPRQRFTMNMWLYKASLPGGGWHCGLSGPSPHGQWGSEMISPASLLPSEGSSSQCHDQVAVFPPCHTLQRQGSALGPSLPSGVSPSCWAEHPHTPQPAGSSPLTHLLLTQCISLGRTCFYTAGLLFPDGSTPHP